MQYNIEKQVQITKYKSNETWYKIIKSLKYTFNSCIYIYALGHVPYSI